MKINSAYLVALFLSPACLAFSSPDGQHKSANLTHVISDYRKSLASLPLDYSLLEKKQLSGVTLHKYSLISQTWSPQDVVSPERWQNGVDIYIPDAARKKNALVVINNGSNDNGSGAPVEPTNYSEEELARISTATRTVVIAVSNIPNQALRYQGVTTPLAEDDSVAYSWKLFMADTQKYRTGSLHVPMAASVSQALRLAKKELKQQKITKFMVTGTSKRAWAAWLTALSDPDVNAVIPFVMDLLDTKTSLEHMYQSYGKNWPIAFYPYYKQGIDQRIETDEFAKLMTLEDPLAYLNTTLGKRLKIDKYIINASGDDFYVPDNSHFYYEQLPGSKSLRVVPNSSHNGILSVTEQSLTTFVNRFQEKRKLPVISEKLQEGGQGKKALRITFSEKPTKILQWTARNPAARDFRYACNVKYASDPISLPTAGRYTLSLPLTSPEVGWQATYVEATFDDGYVATTQVYVTPDEKYPETAPPSKGGACQTLPGRGLNTLSVTQ
ncbi:MAG: PhoPQ-activated protein PqaA family protein [Pantoea sp.]|uniref:PhoPQ-activated pathogenicity-related family protein n=1 Tax=Pantoea sp. TaxID=69393 RepID=UPI00291328F5|nr:PhoPQ-activated protein PqaA family protein [Pantoea sp.]MDU5780677.1 PhoPQ-activated protein PqaA family protein [Pantoea sp.]